MGGDFATWGTIRSQVLRAIRCGLPCLRDTRNCYDEVFPRLRGSMRCDRRTTQAGARGYALRAPVPELGLQAGDRLEPSDDMPDHSLFHTTPTHFRATCWRRGAETSATRRNPVFSEETHLSPQELMGDWLHACSLGIFQAYLALLLHTLMAENVFRLPGSTKTDWWVLFAARIRANLFAWYKRENGRATFVLRCKNSQLE